MNSNLLHCGGANLPAAMGGSRRRLFYVARFASTYREPGIYQGKVARNVMIIRALLLEGNFPDAGQHTRQARFQHYEQWCIVMQFLPIEDYPLVTSRWAAVHIRPQQCQTHVMIACFILHLSIACRFNAPGHPFLFARSCWRCKGSYGSRSREDYNVQNLISFADSDRSSFLSPVS